jgi:small subunit ribosomal protein S20
MPHHKQFEKTLRRDAKRRLENRSKRSRLRHAVKELRSLTDATKAAAMLPEVAALLDKGAKTNLIHARTADRMKSRLALSVQRLGRPGAAHATVATKSTSKSAAKSAAKSAPKHAKTAKR